MKLSYPYVFQDGGGVGDSEITGHSLPAAFVRFLLSLAAAHHTYYSNESRVILTDEENQIIELGLARLTEKAMLNIVFEGNLTANIDSLPNTAITLPFVPASENQNYCTWDNISNRLYFSSPGRYQVNFVVTHYSTPAGVTNFSLTLRRNGTAVALSFGARSAPNETRMISTVVNVVAGNYLDFRYTNQGPSSVAIASLSTGTGVQVIRYG